MKIVINNKEYEYLIGYQKNEKYRAEFNNLAKKVFGLSFEYWYQAGYWNEKYAPYTLFDGEKAVANVSVNIIDFNILNKLHRYIQIGTVMTDEEYRDQGLSRFLMEKVLDEWNPKCDLVYLFANKAVLNLYPKFGFTQTKEYVYFKNIEPKSNFNGIEKMNMDLQINRDKLYDYAKNTNVFSKISMQGNADLVMFYCIQFFKENIYYIKSLDVITVAKFDGNQLHLMDIFGKEKIDLDAVIYSLANPAINEVLLGFTPINNNSYQVKELIGDDTLFIQKDKTQLFEQNKIMFPLLSHA